jgi:hypothetical protein
VVSLSRRTTNNPKIKPKAIDSSGKPGITTVAVWVIVDVVWYGDIVATTGLIRRRLVPNRFIFFLQPTLSIPRCKDTKNSIEGTNWNDANGRTCEHAYASESSDPSTIRFSQQAGLFRDGESNVFRRVLE